MTATERIDTPELLRVLAHVEANQEFWRQSEWRVDLRLVDKDRCGTAYCFAGWKCQLDGVVWRHDADYPDSDLIVLPNGRIIDAEGYASEALGVEHTRGEDGVIPLFAEGNTLDDLKRIVAELVAEAEVAS